MNSKIGLHIGVVGATGAVGKQLLSILKERNFPVRDLKLFSSPRSQGKEVRFDGKNYRCQVLEKGCFDSLDLVFFDASDAISKEWVLHAAEAGAWVIDNSAVYRMDPEVLLLVPEVNGDLLEKRLQAGKNLSAKQRILSGPNCSTVQLVMALKPIRDRFGIKRVVVSTYQSASGAGAAAVDELTAQARGFLDGIQVPAKAFSHQIAFNCIPQIGGFKDSGYTSEEQKIMEESRKLLAMPNLRISATAVRVPTFSCHGESVNVECEREADLNEARSVLIAQRGVIFLDEPAKNSYPMGMTSPDDHVEGATGRDAVYVGRLRKDPSLDSGLNLWVVSDNLRKGAALNAIQIGEILLQAFH